ncbi:FAD:protein FMN transferase [Gemmatimonadota bacterium]
MNATGRWTLRLGLVLVVVLIAAGIRLLGGLGAGTQAGSYVNDSFVMGTVMTVKIRGVDHETAESAAAIVVDEAHRLHKIFDPHDSLSEMSLLNRAVAAGGGTVPISSDAAWLLAAAIAVRDSSGRSFDPALGELIDLWGFSEEKSAKDIPDSLKLAAIADSLASAARIFLSADNSSAIVPPGAGRLDVGGIAKGYAVDRVIEILDSLGIANALVNLGGEIGVLGVGSNGSSWRVGIQHPRMAASHLGVVNETAGWYVATSGDYERFFIRNGHRYHHILNPATGFPATENAVISTTVIASSCLLADALATAAFVLGPEEGIRFLERQGAHGLILYAAGGDREGGEMTYQATSGFLKIMRPDLDGKPIY